MGAQEVLESTIEAYEFLEAQSKAILTSWAGVLSKLPKRIHISINAQLKAWTNSQTGQSSDLLETENSFRPHQATREAWKGGKSFIGGK